MTETRVALVSGANRGIGLEIVRQLSRLGVVAVIGSRDLDKGRAAADKLLTEGLEVPVVALDVADASSPARAVAEVQKLLGRCDVLVNNAGVLLDGPGGFDSSLFDLKDDTARLTYETNVLGPLRLIQACVPVMREQGYGRIVNVSSGAGQLSDMGKGFPSYRMSKSALNALTRITANEVVGANIKVNAVCPGWVKTDMGGPEATRSIAEGAACPVWAATLPDNGASGGFFRDNKPIAW
jgi:NAD(P)-dependent dehydrogenase (short-subunit alcohol dehydrogenase family)